MSTACNLLVLLVMKIVILQVKKIPETFNSPADYKNSFMLPLLEETHSDLHSNLTGVAHAHLCEVTKVERDSKQFKLPKSLFYQISFKSTKEYNGKYDPEPGDLIAFTDIMPKRVDDLSTHKCPYNVAYVIAPKDDFSGELSILSSKCLTEFDLRKSDAPKMYAVHLMNMTTNIRIWKALNSESEGEHLDIIKKVLRPCLNVRITLSFFFFFFFSFSFSLSFLNIKLFNVNLTTMHMLVNKLK